MDNEFKSFFKRVAGNEGDRCRYPTRLDTYGCGCQHNCGYCYARSLLDFRKLWNPAYPSVANINRIRHTVRTKLRPGEIVRLGGMTDCFQPMERERGVTLQTIKALNEMKVGYLIVTKSDLVADDEYMAAMDRDLAHIQVSVTCTDEPFSKRMEPGAPPPIRRIEAVQRLQAEGFDVAVRLSPLIPELVDFDVINRIRCDKVLVEFLRVNTWIRKWLSNLAPDIDLGAYCEHHAGYDHLPLGHKIMLLSHIQGFKELSVCEDVEEHQRFWARNRNADPEDCCNLRKPKKDTRMREWTHIALGDLEMNTGQIEGLPSNPRTWTQTEVDRLAESLLETPELFEARPCIVYPHGGKYVILGGNLRYKASCRNKAATVPCIIVPEGTDARKLGEIVLKDNGQFGEWDYASLLEDWGDVPLEELGITVPGLDDYSGKNTEIDPDSLKETITLKLRYEPEEAEKVREALGDDPRQTLLDALGYDEN